MLKLLLVPLFLLLLNCQAPPQVPPSSESPPAPPPSFNTLTTPDTDPNFHILPNGKSLSSISVSGSKLTLTKGTGRAFGAAEQAAFEKAKVNPKIYWSFRNLTTGAVVAESPNAQQRMFGASSSKVFVGGALLDQKLGKLSESQLQLMADMLVVSSNSAWTGLQAQIGAGDSNKGRAYIYEFTKRLGLQNTRGFQGTWGTMHGNELNAFELALYMQYVYRKTFPGAETLWKLMHTCRTGASKSLKYIPTSVYSGGKTGTYDGPTEVNGQQMSVAVRNHVIVFNHKGTEYAIAVLANTGSEESAALIAGGLYRTLP